MLGCRFPTITDVRSSPWGKSALRALASWRYRFERYDRPWELDFAQKFIRLWDPRVSSLLGDGGAIVMIDPAPATIPTVSIIMPTFNRLNFLRASVDSVFAQTFQSWELIVADDGSEGETAEYLSKLADLPRVRLLRLAHTGNPGAVRNAALRVARGEYVAFLDSDDVWMPTKLEVQLAALRASGDCHWSYTDHVRINDAGQSINSERNPRRTLPDGDIVEALLRLRAGTPTPTVMAERELIERAGGFDQQQGLHEDYDLWLRLALLSKVLVLAGAPDRVAVMMSTSAAAGCETSRRGCKYSRKSRTAYLGCGSVRP